MARFRYRLATLLRLKESARDERRAQLAEAYRAAEILVERLREVDEEIAATRGHAQELARSGKVDIDYLLNSHRYERVLGMQRKVIEQQQQQIAAEVERRRLALVEADREVRVLEKLREKKLHEHLQREDRRDQKLMDELAARSTSKLGEVTT
jgi:flagellar FliJ protein